MRFLLWAANSLVGRCVLYALGSGCGLFLWFYIVVERSDDHRRSLERTGMYITGIGLFFFVFNDCIRAYARRGSGLARIAQGLWSTNFRTRFWTMYVMARVVGNRFGYEWASLPPWKSWWLAEGHGLRWNSDVDRFVESRIGNEPDIDDIGDRPVDQPETPAQTRQNE
jgi:hypothetical protein